MATVTGWDATKGKAEEHTKGSGKYLRLEDDGDAVVGAFVGEPCAREVIWEAGEGGKNRPVPFTEEHAKAGKKPRLQIAIAFFNKETQQVQIFEQGVVFFRALMKVREKYGLENWWFEIKRDGKKGDTKTTYVIFPEEKLSDQEKKDLAGLDLPNLEESFAGDGDDDDGGAKADGKKAASSNGLISDAARTKLVQTLKELPHEKMKAFLEHFDVARVRDLPAAKEADAIAYVATLKGGGSAATEEVDPFE